MLHEQRNILRRSAQAIAPTIRCLKFNKTDPSVGVVICHVKDGHPYLPHFLRHYRSIGVKRFAIIDNGSTDGGKDYLLTQEDCDVYECPGDYKASRSGMLWKNVVMARYQASNWIFSADVDELATYEGWPQVSLDEFASNCSQSGLSAVIAIMVDMYNT